MTTKLLIIRCLVMEVAVEEQEAEVKVALEAEVEEEAPTTEITPR